MELPVATPTDTIESIESSHVAIQRKRGMAREIEAEKVTFLAEEKQQKMELAESGEAASPTFEGFQELPKELRLKIWNLALPGPRFVEISFSAPEHPFINSHRNTLSILHVCSESRTEALKSYTALPLELDFDPLRVIYVNLKIDSLYFKADNCCSKCWRGARSGLRPHPTEQLIDYLRFHRSNRAYMKMIDLLENRQRL